MSMVKTVVAVRRKHAVLGYFVHTLLSSSYRTKSFGFLWALLDPLLYMAVYYLVFGVLIRHRPLGFMLHLYVGIIVFTRFLTAACVQSAGILRGQAGLIREIAFPKSILPLAVVLARLFDLGVAWVAAIVLALLFRQYPTLWWGFIPLAVAVQLCFVLGLSFMIAYAGVFFADVENILNAVLRLWFYMTPILYPLSDIEHKLRDTPHGQLMYQLYLLNPMVSILQLYEAPVMRHQLPEIGYVIRAVAVSVATLILGLYIFSRAEGQIGKYV